MFRFNFIITFSFSLRVSSYYWILLSCVRYILCSLCSYLLLDILCEVLLMFRCGYLNLFNVNCVVNVTYSLLSFLFILVCFYDVSYCIVTDVMACRRIVVKCRVISESPCVLDLLNLNCSSISRYVDSFMNPIRLVSRVERFTLAILSASYLHHFICVRSSLFNY
uniref:Uncharacterized protein n=1 Tax=Cacopsylla melanoneura TaxID=428564 RepID=A0A8D8X5J4_9HEMI